MAEDIQQEIERKWILKELPSFIEASPVAYERHFLFIGEKAEIRVQKKGERYEFERKYQESELSRDIQKFEITKEEFEDLKQHSIGGIERESYLVLDYPEVSIKVYRAQFEGLIRAEIEFESEEAAKVYNPPDWFGQEITGSDLGKDKKLLQLNGEKFNKLLKELV